jgi:hypothetical protein
MTVGSIGVHVGFQPLRRHKKNPKTTYALGGTQFVASFRFSKPRGGVVGDGAAWPDLMSNRWQRDASIQCCANKGHVVAHYGSGEQRSFGTGFIDHRHRLLTRAVISTGLIGARAEEPFSRAATGHVHCSKFSVIVSGMNLVRMAYICRSPLLCC